MKTPDLLIIRGTFWRGKRLKYMHMQQAFPQARGLATPRSAPKRRFDGPLILLAAVLFLALAGWTLAAAYLVFRFEGPILPGVKIGETNVGGMTLSAAAAKIDNDWNRDRVLLVTDGTHTWQATPLDFGLWVDPNATARAAFDYGRGKSHWGQILGAFLGVKSAQVTPVVVFSAQMANAQLANWGALVQRDPGPATLAYQNGQWQAVPGAAGVQFDPAATLQQLSQNYSTIMQSGQLALVTHPVPSPTGQVEAQLATLQSQLDRPLLVHGYDPITNDTLEWSVPADLLASWIQVKNNNGQIALSIDESGFPAYLNDLEKNLSGGRTFWISGQTYDLTGHWQRGDAYTVVIQHPSTTYTVQNGDTLLKIAYRSEIPYWMILQANPDIDPDVLPVGTTLTIPSQSDLLPLPVVLGKRIVLSISQQHMYIYENGQQIRDFVISTGIDRSPTQPGIYQVQTHVDNAYASVWDLYMPDFLGIYQSWPGFWNGIHGLPTLSNGQRLWAGLLGKPVSYGCIILDLDASQWLYTWAEDGVVVEIQP